MFLICRIVFLFLSNLVNLVILSFSLFLLCLYFFLIIMSVFIILVNQLNEK